MSLNRYANKRHRGPTHRGFKIREQGYEGNIPVIVAERVKHFMLNGEHMIESHVRGFYLHPTKGWRSTGPEGRR